MGQTIEVEYTSTLAHEREYTGLARIRFNKILLQSNCEGVERSETLQGQTFCHELIHFILHYAGEDQINGAEDRVHVLAGLLHQALTTMEYTE